jgi:hypothetical protein
VPLDAMARPRPCPALGLGIGVVDLMKLIEDPLQLPQRKPLDPCQSRQH